MIVAEVAAISWYQSAPRPNQTALRHAGRLAIQIIPLPL
jgi:hypothetical protein